MGKLASVLHTSDETPPRSLELQPGLEDALNAMHPEKALEVALKCLHEAWEPCPVPLPLPGDWNSMRGWRRIPGLTTAAHAFKNRMTYRSAYGIPSQKPRPFGFGRLAEELNDLRDLFICLEAKLGELSEESKEWTKAHWTVSKRKKHLAPISPELLQWIESVQPVPTPEKWKAANVCGLFPITQMTETPEGDFEFEPKPIHLPMAGQFRVLSSLIGEWSKAAQERIRRSPGARHVFPPPPADFGLYEHVREVLEAHGQKLIYLDVIASAIYAWGTGGVPLASKGARSKRTNLR